MGELKDYQVIHQVTVGMYSTGQSPTVTVKQYDNAVRVLLVSLVSNNLPYKIPSSFTVRLRGTRTDGKGIMVDAFAIAGNRAYFEITNAMTAIPGRFSCDVELSNASGAVIKTASLWMDVKWSPLQDGTVQASETYQSLEAALAKIGDLSDLETDDKSSLVAAINEAAKTGNGGSAELPENAAYLQDVIVDEASADFIPMLSPNGTEYRLSIGNDGIPIIKNISGTTVWTGTSGGAGGDAGGDSGGDTDATWANGVAYTLVPISGGYISKTNGAVISDATWAYTDYMPCAGAARICISGSTNSHGYNAFYDINKSFISDFGYSANCENEITVPTNAAYFRVSNNSEAAVSGLTIIPYEF